MLETFAKHVALAQEAFGVRAPAWDGALEPAKLAEMLVFSFLEDVWFALISTVLPVELYNVGTLKRIEGGRIIFFPDCHLGYEAEGEARDEYIHATTRLREVAECMLKESQRQNVYFYDIPLGTLFNGLCLAIHDAICGSAGFYLEGIGTFFHNGYFKPDRALLKKIRAENSAKVFEEVKPSSCSPETRRRNNNQAWY